MRVTLFLKYTDLIVQIVSFLFPVFMCIKESQMQEIIWGYFSVGGAQYLSCVLNKVFLSAQYRGDSRKLYEVILLVLTLIFGLAFLLTTSARSGTSPNNPIYALMYIFLVLLLIIGPFLAIWYGAITLNELKKVRSFVNRKQWV